ncbi:TusA-related sulfurtransferase [Phycicoccus badiiscoriae]|uniref:TusA-related sulfurtransferase n=1 Tax=Pedococcus badiiscoriae TaxID=642776 RepID=A0A852W9T8_9MICO|nr:TusA-related sulfurtransferase [Pedococcus badiiscoriae]
MSHAPADGPHDARPGRHDARPGRHDVPEDPVASAPVVVDARGLRCPLPVIRLAQVAADAPRGAVIEVWATDPAARADIPAWCRLRGQTYLGEVPAEGGAAAYRVRLAS